MFLGVGDDVLLCDVEHGKRVKVTNEIPPNLECLESYYLKSFYPHFFLVKLRANKNEELFPSLYIHKKNGMKI